MRRAYIVPVLLLLILVRAPTPALAGYCHYWQWKVDPDPKKLAACATDMNRILAARGNTVVISPPMAQWKGLDVVHYGGLPPQDCEDFIFPGSIVSRSLYPGALPPQFIGLDICKTNYLPYDEVVTACLIVARDHFTTDELSITSDGTWEEWADGAALYETVFERPAQNPLDPQRRGGTVAAAPIPPAVTAPPARSGGPVSRAKVIQFAAGGLVGIVLLAAAVWAARRQDGRTGRYR